MIGYHPTSVQVSLPKLPCPSGFVGELFPSSPFFSYPDGIYRKTCNLLGGSVVVVEEVVVVTSVDLVVVKILGQGGVGYVKEAVGKRGVGPMVEGSGGSSLSSKSK